MVEEEEEEEIQDGDFDEELSEEEGDNYRNCFGEDGQTQYKTRTVTTRGHPQEEVVVKKKKGRSGSRKARKKKDTDTRDEDPDRRPFGQDFHKNKQNQRLQSHTEKMAPAKKAE